MEEKKIVLLSIIAGEESGIEIQIHASEEHKLLLLGLIEQAKYDLLSGKKPDSGFDQALSDQNRYDA